jgi:uncharacterized protein
MKLERPLDDIEIRVLGSLLEKEQSTPEYYPLTLNQLRSACNQTTSREPAMTLPETNIERALERLQELSLVWKVHRSRATRWEHRLDSKWGLQPELKAIMTLLLLRGPQTAGELRSRSERLHRFGSVDEVEGVLREAESAEDPLLREMEKMPGQKETRWTHLVGSADPEMMPVSRPVEVSESLTDRVSSLEARLEELEERLRRIEGDLGV